MFLQIDMTVRTGQIKQSYWERDAEKSYRISSQLNKSINLRERG
jgi:outer membrane receptor for monomeric catechols